MDIEIREWSPEYAQDYIDLSIEWLEKYVYVEPADIEILHNPEKVVLDKGGMIYFAAHNGVNIGTVTMIPMGEGVYELAKLGVTEEYKGNHISDLLMEVALRFAREHHARKIYLFTSTLLVPAIHLYYKYGFKEVPLIDNEYESSDLKMELDLIS